MKKIAIIWLVLSLTGCGFQVTGDPLAPPKAVYFVRGQGELSSGDLKAYPEVMVVHTFADLKKAAAQTTALWVDRSATPFDPDEQAWINEAPQMYYPMVLIGTSDTLHAFRDLLGICCFAGPAEYPGMDAPGFSVSQTYGAGSNAGFGQGYAQKPTVRAILEITNALLEGKLVPAPSVAVVPAASPTR
jgi:hypothetical protein